MFKFDFDVDEIDEGLQSVFSTADVGSSHTTASDHANGNSVEDVSREISLDDLVCIATLNELGGTEILLGRFPSYLPLYRIHHWLSHSLQEKRRCYLDGTSSTRAFS